MSELSVSQRCLLQDIRAGYDVALVEGGLFEPVKLKLRAVDHCWDVWTQYGCDNPALAKKDRDGLEAERYAERKFLEGAHAALMPWTSLYRYSNGDTELEFLVEETPHEIVEILGVAAFVDEAVSVRKAAVQEVDRVATELTAKWRENLSDGEGLDL